MDDKSYLEFYNNFFLNHQSGHFSQVYLGDAEQFNARQTNKLVKVHLLTSAVFQQIEIMRKVFSKDSKDDKINNDQKRLSNQLREYDILLHELRTKNQQLAEENASLENINSNLSKEIDHFLREKEDQEYFPQYEDQNLKVKQKASGDHKTERREQEGSNKKKNCGLVF